MEPLLMTRPRPPRLRCGCAARLASMAEVRLVSMTVRQSSSRYSSGRRRMFVPALFTRMSSPPSRVAVASTMAATLASATGGIELVSRMLSRWRGTAYEPRLEELLDELREERSALQGQMRALGLPVRQYKQAAVWLGEKVSRAKPNGHLLSRS